MVDLAVVEPDVAVRGLLPGPPVRNPIGSGSAGLEDRAGKRGLGERNARDGQRHGQTQRKGFQADDPGFTGSSRPAHAVAT